MSSIRQHKSILFTAISLVVAVFILPLSIQLLHSFETHEHNTCKEITTHLHEKEIDCSICDFHLLSFEYTFDNYTFSNIHKVLSSVDILYSEFQQKQLKHTNFLRGPPLLS